MRNGSGGKIMGDYEKLLLGALLHDIGDFWQRSGKSGEYKKLCGDFCIQYLPPGFQGADFASLHGSPKEYLSEGNYQLKKIVIGDWLSGEKREERVEGEKEVLKKECLISVFSEIELNKEPPQKFYYPLKKLELRRDLLFPALRCEEPNYSLLWDEFVDDVQKISHFSDFGCYFNTLYHLLHKYTWCVPSATYKDVPNISLFDHQKTTCAIVACLKDVDGAYLDGLISALRKKWEVGGGVDDKNTEEDERILSEKRFLLIGGDISGIQKFIYTITSKGAAKSLKGRSLYLQLLTEVIAKYVLRGLGLPIANLLYCGGGHFYILAPGNSEKELGELREEISKKLLQFHRGEPYLVLAHTPLGAIDFIKEKFGKKWEEVTDKLNEQKKRKFSEILDEEHYKEIFGFLEEGGENNICDCCKNESELDLIEDEEGNKFCSLCKSFIDLSKEVKDANYLIEIYTQKEGENIEKGTYRDIFSKFGFDIRFVPSLSGVDEIDAEQICVYRLNNTDFLNEDVLKLKTDNISFGFKFIPKTVPKVTAEDLENFEEYFAKYKGEVKEGDIASIDVLAKRAKKQTGIEKAAILRMDVDNLGKIFSEGLGENRTIARVSTLSSMLSLFFEGYLNEFSEKTKSYQNQVYVVYSGGDDSLSSVHGI